MKIKLVNARLSFADLFTPKSINGGAPKFTGTFIASDETKIKFTKDNGEEVIVPHASLSDVVDKVLTEKFGKLPAKVENWLYNKADGSTTRAAFTNQEGDYWDGFDANTMYVSAGKKESDCMKGQLDVVDQQCQQIDPTANTMHSGVYVDAVLDVYAYDGGSGKGVTAQLLGVQLRRGGEALGATPISVKSEFENIEIEGDEDPNF
jgi:hypothetical protein